MDESRKPGNFAPANYPSQVEDGFGENPGATGVFGTALPLQADRASGPLNDIDQDDDSGQSEEFRVSAPPASAPASREGLQEPIVHKVVLGSGSAAAPIDLLELLRSNAPAAEPAPASSVPAQSAQPSESSTHQPSEGFTQLLSALGRGGSQPLVPRPPAAVQNAAPVSASNVAGHDSGFTELLRRPNTEEPARQPGKPLSAREPAPSPAPSDGASGFTSLLQGFSGKAPGSSMRQATPASIEEKNKPISPLGLSDQPRGAVTASPSGQGAPGTFTQLFSTVTSNAAEASTPVSSSPVAPVTPSPVRRPSAEEASFTQLISTIGDTPYKASAGGANRAPDVADFLRTPVPEREAPLASSQRPSGNADWPRESAPQQEPLPASAGITRLLRVLDQPAKEPERAVEYAPPSAPAPPASESFFTQTYKKLEGTAEPVRPTPPAPQPTYAPPANFAAPQTFASPFNSASFAGQGQAAPAAPSPSAGPSEVTRIIDASKLREMQRGGAAASAPASPAAPAQPSPAPMSFPTPPALPNLQWQPPVPHAPAPGQPMHFGGGMQMPPYAMPAMPQPPAPAAPTPAAPAANKMQQYLPLLLIVIIFLLVVILVTVVFLLKH